MPLQQKQYLTHYAPMIIERWALPIFKKAGFTPVSTRSISWSAIECACCEVCFLYYGLEPGKTKPPYDDMYICDFCSRSYHWACLKITGCYTHTHTHREREREREEVDKNDNWACPACADLSAQQKQKRRYESYDKEQIKITWKPTREPEVTRNKWPAFHKHILDFEACKDEPNLTMLPPDDTMSNMDNTWNYKLDSELRNKVSFGTYPTNPQADIIATGRCEFWVMDIDLINPTPKNTHPLRPPHQTDPPSPTTKSPTFDTT